MRDILFVPSLARGNGSGHLARCFELAKTIGPRAAIYVPEQPLPGERGLAEILLAYRNDFDRVRVVSAMPATPFSLIVLDRRKTTRSEYERWAALGTVVALDEGGEARECAEYLIDVLPRMNTKLLCNKREANVADLGFLSLPRNRRRNPPEEARRVLVSFGGEDPASLAGSFVELAVSGRYLAPESMTVVSGALRKPGGADSFDGVSYVGPIQDLKERLADFDLVVTQFGLTAFEAAWAGCAVLLLNPSRYHERLARLSGFASIGVGRPDKGRLSSALKDIPALSRASAALAPASRRDLAAFIAGIDARNAGACPNCGHRYGKVAGRFERKTYRVCGRCGIMSMAYFMPRAEHYTSHDYFFRDYKAQYGKTYLEDLPNLRRMASARLDIIERLLPAGPRGASVLDVGCAYGAFLAEAQSRGWNPAGTDVSGEAVSYVRGELGIPAFVADFSADDGDGLYPRPLDCVSLWYVIEHFSDLAKALARARALLKEGGILAFSTPSASGISARRRLGSFLENSPDDHMTVWDPGSLRRILKPWGFDVQVVRVTGHHPERFSGVPNDPRSPRFKAMAVLSRLFGLGDTFECYAVKRSAKG